MDALSERLAARALALCRVPSPTGEERALCDAIEAWAKGLGAACVRAGNSLVVGAPASGPAAVALVGHLDTVPAAASDGPPRIEGERLHGRGASDMKGGLAVALDLFEARLSRGASLPPLVLYEREEGPYGENGLEGLFAAGLVPRVGLAVCLEPTAGALQLGCVGSLHATVRFRGRSAHSARPWEGANAVHAAGPLLARLQALLPREVVSNGLVFREVATVTRASGGLARNVVPDVFELNLNYRFAPGKGLDAAQADVRDLVGGDDGGRSIAVEIEFTDLSPSGPVCLGNPAVQALAQMAARVEPKQAWTDVARFAAHGIDAVNFGPGEPSQAHQAGEWAEIARLGEAWRLLDRLLDGRMPAGQG